MYEDRPTRVSLATSTTPHRIGVGVGAVLVLIAAASVATDSASSPSAPADPGPAPRPGAVAAPAKSTETARPSPSPASGPSAASAASAASGEKAVLPDLVGRSLAEARQAARTAGFSLFTVYDAAGRSRAPLVDRGWKVCAQTPLPGTHPTRVEVEFAAARLTERCPA